MAHGLPVWAEEVRTLLPACAHLLVTGNIRDIYLGDEGPVGDLVEVLRRVFASRGIDLLLTYDISVGATIAGHGVDVAEQVEQALGGKVHDLAPPDSIAGLAELVERVSLSDRPIGLVLLSASRLILAHERPSDDELEAYRRFDRIAHDARPGAANQLFNPVIWALESEQDVPTWFAVGNEKLRSIVVPYPDAGERYVAATALVKRLPARSTGQVPGEAGRAGPAEAQQQAAKVLAQQTAGLTIVAMESIVKVAEDQGWPQERLEDAARAYRVGIVDNPWRHPYLPARLRDELVELDAVAADPTMPTPTDEDRAGRIVHTVIGQDAAVRRALEVLVRSVVSMTSAHTASATRPRGVLFLAGPTGVGKTELAKALTRLIFDDERLCIRFDMSEFAAEHSADRFIGAPPGYAGYERGGELTNAVRKQPFSVVLFDEIEKAHPLVLDKFLQLLDDGRLTDGRGETAYFTESLIVFTSNLGIYETVFAKNDDGSQMPKRVLVVRPEQDDTAAVEEKVRAGIEQHFNLHLGRPELLNRIGDNIVVFDFIREPTGLRITAQMIDNVLARVRDEHGIEVDLSGRARAVVFDECRRPKALRMGGRGISSTLETVLVNPLAMAIFLRSTGQGPRMQVVDLVQRDGVWQAVTDDRRPAAG
jgi:ATP-dependent Clp protease ATP-binding subunit ClpB